MDLLLDEAQTFLQQAVSGAVERYAPFSTIREWISAVDLAPADRLAAAQGWTGIGLAEHLGGQGGAVLELAVVAEQLGRGAVPWDRLLGGYLATQLLAALAERGRELAAANASGERAVVLCLDARTPDAAPAIRVDSGRVTGASPFVLGATSAHVLVVATPAAHDEVELLAVERDAEGVAVTPRRLVDRTRSLADVRFDASPGELLGRVPAAAWQQMIQTGIVLSCADSLGASARLLEMTAAYVQERHQFGVAIGSFQAVKHSAAQMLVDVEGIHSSVQYSAWAVETAAEDAALQASVAGAFCSQAAPDLADRALFLHGAIGYTWEHNLQLPFKRIKSNAHLFGSADWHRDRISRALGCTPAP
jgi:alkylation response protein AidB-like acyl-CoA dehydrogenase